MTSWLKERVLDHLEEVSKMHPSNLIENYVREVKIDRVVCGDTVELFIELGWDMRYASKMRLKGVYAPAVKTEDNEERIDGLRSKEALEQVLEKAHIIMLHCHDYRKDNTIKTWGILYADGMNVNEFMTANGFAEEGEAASL